MNYCHCATLPHRYDCPTLVEYRDCDVCGKAENVGLGARHHLCDRIRAQDAAIAELRARVAELDNRTFGAVVIGVGPLPEDL